MLLSKQTSGVFSSICVDGRSWRWQDMGKEDLCLWSSAISPLSPSESSDEGV